MAMNLRQGLFVTGVDTDVGKTQVAAAIAWLLAARGISVRPRKPVESGCRRLEGRLWPGDAHTLKDASTSPEPLERICPYPLEPALSPERAAKLAGLSLTLDDLRAACLAGATKDDFLLVEGAGGFYSPLIEGALNADLAAVLDLPVLLVVADRLGVINQTLLAVEAIERRRLPLTGVVLNRIEPCRDHRMDNAADLSQWLSYPLIVTEFYGAAPDRPVWLRLCHTLLPWIERWLAGS